VTIGCPMLTLSEPVRAPCAHGPAASGKRRL
jgi:hypothetical protein